MPNRIVLMYHDVYYCDTSESGFQNATAMKYKISIDAFESQVRAVGAYLQKLKLPASQVEFTFDDGGISFLTIAAPILEKHGFRGIFFITTGYIGSNGFLDAEQIRELVRRGHKVGSHSHSHPQRMSALSSSEIYDEWNISQMMLREVIGESSTVASIPNGYLSRAVLDAMADAGISEIYTSSPTLGVSTYRNAIIKGRYSVTDSDTVESVISIVSSPFTRFGKTVRHYVINIAKAILGDTYLTIRELLIK